MKKHLLSLIAIMAILNLYAQNLPKRELRGAWLTTHLSLDWPNRTQTPLQQRNALINFLNYQQQTGVNAFYFQVRSQSDAMYASTIEPWSYYLTGAQGVPPNPLWDPMQFAIEEARKRGMEFHAWFNPYRAVANTANLSSTTLISNQHIARTKPEWMLTVGTVQILNPGLPEVRDYLTSVITDVLTRYDIDGIHFDDYFYPNGTIPDAETFQNHNRGFTNISDWRRDNINLLIKRVNDSIASLKPWVKFGVSPTGIYRSSTNPAIGSNTSAGALQHYTHLFADTRKWLSEGWVDYLMPQLYWYIGQPGSDYAVLAQWWNNNAFNRHIYIGIAAYKVNDPAQGSAWANPSQVPNQVRLNRSHPNIFGEVYFRSAHLVANPLGFRDSLRLNLYKHPALLPKMSWKDDTPPAAPSSLTAERYRNDSVVLKWNKPEDATSEFDKVRQIVIYRSTEPQIDLNNGANILAIIPNGVPTYVDKTIASNKNYYYTVTALDRLHNESDPANIVNDLPPQITCPGDDQVFLDAACTYALADYSKLVSVISSSSEVTISQVPAAGNIVTGRGTTTVTISATDKGGNTNLCTLNVHAYDTIIPVIANAYADPSVLAFPVNHKMRTVNVQYDVMDNCGSVTTILTVSSNEPEYGIDHEDVGPDWEVINENQVLLRAERDSEGSGRIYTIIITATDAEGNVTTEEVLVTVPHRVTRPITNSRINGRNEQMTEKNFSIKAIPNPSQDQFNILVNTNSDERIQLRVTDNLGRLVEKRLESSTNRQLHFGRNYKAGVYFVEIIQGEKRDIIKVVKTSD